MLSNKGYKGFQAMKDVSSFAEGRVMFYHVYIADKKDICKHHVSSMKVIEKEYEPPGIQLQEDKRTEYFFSQKGEVLEVILYDDEFLPEEKQGRNIFYVRDVYKYNQHGDPIEHQQYVMGEKNVQRLEDFRYEYAPDGRLIQAEVIDFADPAHGVAEYYYFDALGRLIREESEDGFLTTYHYDENGRLDEQKTLYDDKSVMARFYYNEQGQLVEYRKEGEGVSELEEIWFRRKFDESGKVEEYSNLLKNGERKTTHFIYKGRRLCRREVYDEQGQIDTSEEILYNETGLISHLIIHNGEGQLLQEEVVEYEYF